MSRNGNCPHLDILQLSLSELYAVKQGYPCSQCDAKGRNLWICLYRTCMNIGCSEHDQDHGTKHFRAQQSHCLQLNLSTRRIWCYLCNTEVFLQSGLAIDASPAGNGMLFGRQGHQQQQRRGSASSNASTTYRDHQRPITATYSSSEDESHLPDDDDDISGGHSGGSGYESGLIGLKNIANTCYMNAALQALSNAPPLHGYFMDCGDIVEATSELNAQQQQHQQQQHQRKAGLARSQASREGSVARPRLNVDSNGRISRSSRVKRSVSPFR